MSDNGKVFVRRLLIIWLLCMLCVLTVLLGMTHPASAASAHQQQAATTCYGGAVPFTVSTGAYGTNQIGPFYTSSRCRDINLRFTNLTYDMPVCVIFIRHTQACNHITDIGPYDTSWHVIASDVLDGTEFYVDFFGCISPLCIETAYTSGYVAY